MDPTFARFLSPWIWTLTVLAAVVVAFDVVVDPYRIFGAPLIKGFNAHKNAALNQTWGYKVYEVQRLAPTTVLLGSSRVLAGLNAHSSVWPADYSPVYNLGLGGGTPYAWFRYLQHVMATHVPRTVIVGVDFEYFLDSLESQHSAVQGFEARLAVSADGTPNPRAQRQHLLDLVQFSLSYDSLYDSMVTVVGNLYADPSDMVLGNGTDDRQIEALRKTGTFPWMALLDIINVRRFTSGPNHYAMTDLRGLLELCRTHGTGVILYIHPMPADTLEMMDQLAYWGMFEDWKRELMRAVSDNRNAGGQVILWDFSDYDIYSTEPLRQDGRVLRWFLESAHYTQALGDLVARRILGRSAVQFGTILTPEGLEAHLTEIRKRQREYRATHQDDVARVHAIHDAATRMLKLRVTAAP